MQYISIGHHLRDPWPALSCSFESTVIMGKLNIAHHKSYHPYRQDNIARVRRDEAEAKLKEQQEEDRALLAVSMTCPPSASIFRTFPCTRDLGCRI